MKVRLIRIDDCYFIQQLLPGGWVNGVIIKDVQIALNNYAELVARERLTRGDIDEIVREYDSNEK